jgi:RNA polymerase sigma-70 factor, ECF subfamily
MPVLPASPFPSARLYSIEVMQMHMVSAAVVEEWTILPDEAVVSHVLDGQVALFEILMRRHNERLFRAARAIVRDEAEAEDVMQEAYVNAYAHLRQFDGRASFATWLTRIAVNEAIGRARRRGRYDSFDSQDPAFERALVTRRGEGGPMSSANNPERQAFAGEMKVILENAIDNLPDGLREVFMLRAVEGLSTAETATSLSLGEDVVKTRLSRARAALRRGLFDHVGAAAAQSFSFLRPRCDRVVASVLARIS